MALFGKKKSEDDEELEDGELEEDGDKASRNLKRKINRDLKPENKKKRKEPPKPWGKKERMIVLVIFLSTVVITGILALSARGYSVPSVSGPNFSLPSIESLNIFKEETIIIHKK